MICVFRRRLAVALSIVLCSATCSAADLSLELRYQVETQPESGRFHRLSRAEAWDAEKTAIIVCDVWDLHHCLNAVRRLKEFAPQLDQVLDEARRHGVTIIHSPSDCMDAYTDHPARQRTITTPKAVDLPQDIENWCSRIPAEERAVYPIDQSDGGEDDDPQEHAVWVAKLKRLGRNPGTPWKTQSELITIDPKRDFISDRGDEVWSILEQRGIENVILTGVHTNMCVLGRPFGLRQMARNGKRVVLMRDLTDTMYNPKRWPFVDHFTGTDLIVDHVERFVCPTVTSDQILGGEPFRSAMDKRPHLVILLAEDLYQTSRTLPEFASRYLGRDFRVSYVHADAKDRNALPGLEVLDEADLVLVSARRRVLPIAAMQRIQQFVRSGKPVVGIRTASHAFSLGNKPVPDGYLDWPQFDTEVFGGSYHGHHSNNLASTVDFVGEPESPIFHGLDRKPFAQSGSLYQPSPLADGAELLLVGRAEGVTDEPVAWTFKRADGGRSFYTSLGDPGDFDNPVFLQLLLGSLYWAADRTPPDAISVDSPRAALQTHWNSVDVPASWESASGGVLRDYDGVGWYRCVVRLPDAWVTSDDVRLSLPAGEERVQVWVNGDALKRDETQAETFLISRTSLIANDANLIAVRVEDTNGKGGLMTAPTLRAAAGNLQLAGRWQFRIGNNASWSNMPLPARFGMSTDAMFEP